MLGFQQAHATKLLELTVVDASHLQVHFADGEVTYADDGQGPFAFQNIVHDANHASVTSFGSPLNLTAAGTAGNWLLSSSDDTDFNSGVAVSQAFRKSKLNGMAEGAWSGSDFTYEHTLEHFLYLKLPTPLEHGKTYTLSLNPSLNSDQASVTFTYNIYETRSEAIKVNTVGYEVNGGIKAADLYMWMGDGGARDYSSYVGNTVYLVNVADETVTTVGTVEFGSSESTEAQGYNLIRSDVWHADFTAFNTPGQYRLAIEGVGASDVFEIGDGIYREPFRTNVLGFYYMRIGEKDANVSPPPRQPYYVPGVSPADTKVVLTTMHPFHPNWGSFSSGDAWDKPDDWAAYVKSGSPENPNAYGGHSDANDWDRHLGHVTIIYDMLLPYFLAGGTQNDDNLGIHESGNGIPDLLDEARNEVDFWLRLRDGDGYAHGLTNPTKNTNILYQAGPTAMAAWANAANAAMLADAFRIAGLNTLSATYTQHAVDAFTHAGSLADQMLTQKQNVGESIMEGNDFKITAAAHLYNLTGDTQYEDVVATASRVSGTQSEIIKYNNFNQIYATAAYLHTPQTVNYPTLHSNMRASVIHQAQQKEASFSSSRPSRRSTDNNTGYFQTIQNVHRSLVAHSVAESQSVKDDLLDALVLEADWGLGRNPLNMIQMTTASTPLAANRSIEYIYSTGQDDGAPGLHPGHTPYLNHDDWFSGMVMGRPSWMTDKCYPAFSNWPKAEGYFPTTQVWAHSEFTPQQTMRGKMALYGYLYGIATDSGTDPDPDPEDNVSELISPVKPGYGGGLPHPVAGNSVIDVTQAPFNVIPNDGQDDTAGIQAAIDSISGSGDPEDLVVIQLPAGQVILSDEIHVDKSGVIIKGRGSDPSSGGTEILFKPWSAYSVSDGEPQIDGKRWPGHASFRVETRAKHPDEQNYEGSVNFHWKSGIRVATSGGGSKGENTVYLEDFDSGDFAPGDLIYVGACNTLEFYEQTNVAPEDRYNTHMRTQFFKVTAVNPSANTLTIDYPLEFDVPYSNNGQLPSDAGSSSNQTYYSRVFKVTAIRNVGFMDFAYTTSLAHTGYASLTENDARFRYENLAPEYAIHGILFKYAEDGWVDNVKLSMAASHPIVTEFARHMTFENVEIDGSWNKGKGGHGYFRNSKLFNSLIQNNTIRNVRHLTLQWSASNNIIRNNDLNCDINLHGGWERYNLIYGNTVEIPFAHRNWENGAPGNETWYPIWWGAGQHAGGWSGATGPYNAFIDNTFRKQKTSGGPMEDWGLYDEPGKVYIFGWDGNAWAHLAKSGTAIETWTQNENIDFSLPPNSGVTVLDSVSPGTSLQDALDLAQPGDVIEFTGTVTGALETKNSGTALQPIIIRGIGSNAVIEGSTTDQGFGIFLKHNYYIIENLTIRNFKKGLVGEDADHIIIRDVTVENVGQEAFKMRKNSNFWLLESCIARNTGLSGNYGEGFYVGDAESNWRTAPDPDTTGYITFLNCYTTDTRNDGYDVKEGAHHVKFINCVANFSNIQPVANDSVGDSGWYIRSNDIQLINCRVEDLTNGGSAFKLFEDSAAGGPYGRNIELKGVSGANMTGHLLWIHKSAVGDATTLYEDYMLDNVSGGLLRTTSAPVTAAAAVFCEMSWNGIGGDKYYQGPSCQNPVTNQLPVAVAAADTLSGNAPLTVNFNGSGSSDPDGDLLSFAWTFGDGNTGTGENTSHTYSTAGTYTVTLQVADGNGGSQTDTLSISVENGDIDPGDSTVIASDDFDSETASGGTGWAGPWVATTGSFYIHDQYSRNGSAGALNPRNLATFERSVDLSGETGNLLLEFYWVKEGGTYDDASEYVRLEVFDGSWHSIRTWEYQESSTSWQKETFDLSAFNRIPGFKIRFINVASSNSEEIFIEDLQILRTDDPANTPPLAQAEADLFSGVVPLTVGFDSSSSSDADGDVLSFDWDFADGSTSQLAAPSHTFTAVGTYQVTLTVSDGKGGEDTDTISITVSPDSSQQNESPTAIASFTAGIGGDPFAYQFFGSASEDPEDDPLTYAWTFGDGQSASGEIVEHTYASPGTYSVSLTVTDIAGNSSSTTIAVAPQYVNPEDAATVAKDDFDTETLSGGSGWNTLSWSADNQNFKVDDEFAQGVAALNLDTTTGGERSVDLSFQSDVYLSFDWLIETGKLDPGEVFTVKVFDGAWHQLAQYSDADATESWEEALFSLASFNMVEDFRVRFELISDNGGEEVFVDNVRVFVDAPTVNQKPTAVVAVSRRAGNAPLAINFDASGSFDVNGDPLTYSWDFGSASSTSMAPSYTFTTLGKHTVQLTVSDGRNGLDTTSLEIEVTPEGVNLNPVANASSSATEGTAPFTVTFDGEGSYDPEGEALSYLWNFGDGETAAGKSSSHTFSTPGKYAVELTVYDDEGFYGHDQVMVVVKGAGEAISGDYRIDPSPNFLAWAVETFGEEMVRDNAKRNSHWGPRADIDGDGRNNILEQAFGTDAGVADTPFMDVGFDKATGRFQVEMHMLASRSGGLVYDLMGSADLNQWELIPEDQYSIRILEEDALGDGRYNRVLLEPVHAVTDRLQFFRFSLDRSEAIATEIPEVLPTVVDDPWSEQLPDLPAAPDDPNNIYRAGLYRETSSGTRVPHAMHQPNPVWGKRLVVSNAANDDRPAIQAAIDAAQPGDEVFLPNGVYDLYSETDSGGAILLKSFVNLRGESREGVIIRVWGSPIAAISALAGDTNMQDIVLSDMSIEKPNGALENVVRFSRNSESADGVGARFTIRNVKVENFYRRGFRIYRVREVVIEDCIATETVASETGYGFEAFGGSSNPLDETKWIVFRNSQAPGPNMRHGFIMQDDVHSSLIEGCEANDNYYGAIELHASGEELIEIRNNIVRRAGSWSIKLRSGGGAFNYVHDNYIEQPGTRSTGLGQDQGLSIETSPNQVENNIVVQSP